MSLLLFCCLEKIRLKEKAKVFKQIYPEVFHHIRFWVEKIKLKGKAREKAMEKEKKKMMDNTT